MTTECDSNQLVPRPVVLAGGSNLHLWPRSRLNQPIQFQRFSHVHSPFQKTMLAAQEIAGDEPIIVCVSSRCVDLARGQIHELDLVRAPIKLIEPVERGAAPPLMMAALLAARETSSCLLVAMEAHCPPQDVTTMKRLTDQLAQSHAAQGAMILTTQSGSKASGRPLPVSRGDHFGDNHLFACTGSTHHSGRDRTNAPAYAGLLFATPQRLMDICRSRFSHLIRCCDLAVQQSGESGHTRWPDTNKWATMQEATIMDLVRASPVNVLLRPVDFMVPDEATKQSGLMADCIDCHIDGNGHLVEKTRS